MGVHFLMLFAFILIMQYLHFSCSRNISCPEIERQSLLKFRKGLIDESNRLSSWVGNDCCTWQGVGCSKTTGRVVKLDLHTPLSYDPAILSSYDDDNSNHTLTKSFLGGEVNPSLLNLKHLNYLDLSWNNFLGAIPKFFGSFKDLRYLNLSCSGFLGKVPHHLGNLSSLEYLDLANGIHFHELFVIPSSVGVMIDNLRWASTLSSLKHLDLSGLEGIGEDSDWFIVVNKFPSLKVLNLAYCGIQSIPPSSNVNLTSLATLDLSGNFLNSTIPLWLSNISGLMHLNLRFNKFHGPIPDSLGMLSFLTVLDLYGNAFSTSIPESLCNLSSLEYLDLSYNQLSGNIPTCFGHLSKLQWLDVSYNSLVGNLSEHHFTELEKLETLHMSSTSLGFNVSLQWVPPFQLRTIRINSCKNIGPQFPQWLQTQRRIEYLSIANSSISDSIPNWFENVSSLIEFLDLSHNEIRGKLPKFQESVVGPLKRQLILHSNRFEGPLTVLPSDVEVLDLSANFLTGNIPFHLCMMKSLYVIDLSGNKLLGGLPSCLGRLISLQVLDVTNNNLHGHIPLHLCMMKSVQVLDLSRNKLSGGIPSCLGRLKFVQVLDLSRNKLSGGLPSCLGKLISLQVLDVTNNNLHGHIPSSLGSLSQFQSLHLHNNRFDGELPLSLQNLTSIRTLDLGVNSFIGIIPPWIGEKLTNLQLLSLQSNLFAGEIPLQLCYLNFLRLLDLSNNNVTGTIPRCISNLTGMTIKSYSDGNYSGYYTENIFVVVKGTELLYTQTIKFLTSIDLSNNNMVGEIPKGLMDLSGLEALNISGNQLNGRIPKTIRNLKHLESLDLSRNKLSGPIPPSLSDLNFLSFLNLSFNELSGHLPTGHQLQTLTDPTIYKGNCELCGPPVFKSCSRNDEPLAHEREGSDDSDHLWFYAGIGPGFFVGFLGFFGVLHFKESWRHSYFQFLENVFNWLALAIAIKLAWLQKKFGTCNV